jgi:hypothetical protein
MSGYRTVAAARGLAWITEGLGALRRDPAPYAGACVLVGLLTSMPLVGSVLGLLMPVFYAGLLALLRTRSEGGRGQVAQAFDGFKQPGAMARLMPIVAFNLAFALAAVAVLAVAAGPDLVAIAQEAEAGGKPDPQRVLALVGRLVLPALALMPVAAYVGWMQMLAIPRAMLDGIAGVAALREAAGAVWVNLGAFVLNLLGMMGLMFALVMVLMVPLALVGAMQPVAPALAFALQVPLLAVFTGAIVGIYSVLMFQASREIFGVSKASPPTIDAIEV